MLDLFKHTGNFMDDDTYDQVVDKIKLALQQLGDRTAPVYKLLSQKPHGDQSFDVWYRKVDEQGKTIDRTGDGAKKELLDAIVMQTSSNKL